MYKCLNNQSSIQRKPEIPFFFTPHSLPGQCFICQPLCILFLLLTYCQTPHCGLAVILYLQHTPLWLSHKPGAATGCTSSRAQAAARRHWLCRGPFSIQLRPDSQDSRLCRDITVLEAFSIPEKTQHWVREQAKKREGGGGCSWKQLQKQTEGSEGNGGLRTRTRMSKSASCNFLFSLNTTKGKCAAFLCRSCICALQPPTRMPVDLLRVPDAPLAGSI